MEQIQAKNSLPEEEFPPVFRSRGGVEVLTFKGEQRALVMYPGS